MLLSLSLTLVEGTLPAGGIALSKTLPFLDIGDV